MAKTKPARKKKEKVKQGHLPEMAPPTIKAIDEAAENYYDVMKKRVVLSKDEDEKKTALIEAMVKAQVTRYEYEDKVVTLTAKSNVSVKPKKEESPDFGE